MYKIDVGLGFSIIKDAYESFNKEILDKKIGQHRVILNDNIINYYKSSASECNMLPFVMTYIQSIVGAGTKSVFYPRDNVCSDPKEELIACVLKTPLKILISNTEEFAGYKTKKIDITTRENIEEHDFSHKFNWYVFPLSKIANKSDDCNDYITWLRRLFTDEEKITIVDPFLLTKVNLRIFLDSLLPTISNDTEIRIYSAIDQSRYKYRDRITGEMKEDDYHLEAERIIQDLNDNHNRKITICWCNYSNMHDRFIVLPNCEIGLTNSFNLLQKNQTFDKSCRFSVNLDHRDLPTTNEELLMSISRR